MLGRSTTRRTAKLSAALMTPFAPPRMPGWPEWWCYKRRTNSSAPAPCPIKPRRTNWHCRAAGPSPHCCNRRLTRSRASFSPTAPVPACDTLSWRRSHTVWLGAASRCCDIRSVKWRQKRRPLTPGPRPCRRAGRGGDRSRPGRIIVLACRQQVVRRTYDLTPTGGRAPFPGFEAWSAPAFHCIRLVSLRSRWGTSTWMACVFRSSSYSAPGTSLLTLD